MSALTGEEAPRGNEILSNSVIGSLQHIGNLIVVILTKEKLKRNFSIIQKKSLRYSFDTN